MDYQSLAGELLRTREELLQVPAQQKLSRIMRGELFVLNYLYSHDTEVHPTELSRKLSVSTARIASLLNHMEEKQLITRAPDSRDSRQIIVALTETGAQAIRQRRGDVLTYLARMLEALGPEDAREYIRIQKKICSSYRNR